MSTIEAQGHEPARVLLGAGAQNAEACAAGHAHDCGSGGDQVAESSDIDPSALVSVRGVVFRRNSRDILCGIDLDVHVGEIVTLIGPNGAGKTTLVKIVLGIEKADQGVVSVPATTRIGYVPQRFEIAHTMPMTVAAFLELGTGASRSMVKAGLEEAGVARLAEQQLAALSGGETQRVLIARALLRNPNLLVLDEPAQGVDTVGEADLYALIGRIRDQRQLGILLVSHDLHVVMARSDRVICLNGHVCCSGQPETVAQHAEYTRLFGAKAASTLGLYRHHHDHAHDLSGVPRPIADGPRPKQGG